MADRTSTGITTRPTTGTAARTGSGTTTRPVAQLLDFSDPLLSAYLAII